MTRQSIQAPDELEFLEHFGVEPAEASPSDGFWQYEFSDAVGFQLVLSFDVLERSLQTVLVHDGVQVARMSAEGMVSLSIDENDPVIRGRCLAPGVEMSVEIRAEPRLSVTWSSLRTDE